jgi:tetrahydromethanopterin S-methyltransferase subunit A
MSDRAAVHELVEPVTPLKEETLFVQNEEQQESNLWSSTVANPITPEEYMKAIQAKIDLEPKVAKFTALIKSGRTEISSVPEDIREEVRKRM